MESLKKGWEEFLGEYAWDSFFTLTFVDEVRARLAVDRALRWAYWVWDYYRWGFGLEGLLVFACAERFRVVGGYHAHGLLMGIGRSFLELPFSLIEAWRIGRQMFGSQVRVESIRRIGGVRSYVAKYLTKGIGELEWDITSYGIDLREIPMRLLDE